VLSSVVWRKGKLEGDAFEEAGLCRARTGTRTRRDWAVPEGSGRFSRCATEPVVLVASGTLSGGRFVPASTGGLGGSISRLTHRRTKRPSLHTLLKFSPPHSCPPDCHSFVRCTLFRFLFGIVVLFLYLWCLFSTRP
jgi:hypothetical protein